MLTDKVAIVTGASRGLGRAMALALASAGAHIAVIYAGREEEAQGVCREAAAMGVRALSYQCDVSDFAKAGETVARIASDIGTPDILINNAGVVRDGLILNMKEEDFDRVVDVSLKGSFNMIRHTAGLMIRARRGRIINITSVAGLIGNAGQANYSAAKAGMIGLTKTVARELAGRGITCNAIAPGFIETDMTAALSERVREGALGMIPMKRMGQAEDIAALARFLASDAAGYITGEVVRVDGGLAM